MADINTKYIRKVIIESENGKTMDDLDFTLDFYVYTNRLQTLKKSELIRVVKDGEVSYYAIIDSQKLGRGNVKCRIRIIDVEPRIKNMERPVVLTREVGIMIGGCCCSTPFAHDCGFFEEGYKVSFEAVTDIPKQDAALVTLRYGVLREPISSYGNITEEMVTNFTASDAIENFPLEVNQGDKVVLLVNADMEYYGCKNDGFGGKVPFNTEVLGANGEYSLTVEDVEYRVYGELSLVSGVIMINTMK